LAAVSSICWLLLLPIMRWAQRAPSLLGRDRLKLTAIYLCLVLISIFTFSQNWPVNNDGNTYVRELSRNGAFQFFAAFRNNNLDYNEFYAKIPKAELGKILRNEVKSSTATFISNDPIDIRRSIDNPGEFKQYNIVLVTIESLSAKYLGSFGDARGLSPWLDQLRKKSVFFNNFYATGTRTDRGLEAITLSIPPTPGRSIVKRIGQENGYGSLGQQLTARGYDSVFVYGGRGYFDNMNAFFSGNGYRIVDQSSVPESEITFKNAWGMADEDIYNQTLALADTDYSQNKPFFLQLMTTSNHRPYSYPDGRIDIRSGSGRDGAVKYTDYAIGKFLAEARKKPWFSNTIFVFVADHCAGSAGMEDLPVANYHIPFFIYAPDIFQPKEIDYLSSQIDIAPTLLGLLNMDYESTFFGRDLLKPLEQPGRAVIGNYQNLGLFDGKDLAILSPRKSIRVHENAVAGSMERQALEAESLVARDVAYYQGASYMFKHNLIAWRSPLINSAVAHAP
jgi:phosphoglycerol transferase MdoB-like AlkP superfamily enzyme